MNLAILSQIKILSNFHFPNIKKLQLKGLKKGGKQLILRVMSNCQQQLVIYTVCFAYRCIFPAGLDLVPVLLKDILIIYKITDFGPIWSP